jgi:hypothetical protein
MSNAAPTTSLPPGQAGKLDALDGVPLSDGERASLTWLAGFEVRAVDDVAVVITRARWTREGGQ